MEMMQRQLGCTSSESFLKVYASLMIVSGGYAGVVG